MTAPFQGSSKQETGDTADSNYTRCAAGLVLVAGGIAAKIARRDPLNRLSHLPGTIGSKFSSPAMLFYLCKDKEIGKIKVQNFITTGHSVVLPCRRAGWKSDQIVPLMRIRLPPKYAGNHQYCIFEEVEVLSPEVPRGCPPINRERQVEREIEVQRKLRKENVVEREIGPGVLEGKEGKKMKDDITGALLLRYDLSLTLSLSVVVLKPKQVSNFSHVTVLRILEGGLGVLQTRIVYKTRQLEHTNERHNTRLKRPTDTLELLANSQQTPPICVTWQLFLTYLTKQRARLETIHTVRCSKHKKQIETWERETNGMRLFSLFMREITLIGVARMFPFSFVESTVCLHTYSLLRLLLACYRNEQPVRGDCKIASRLISRMIIQKTRASFHKTTDKTAIGVYTYILKPRIMSCETELGNEIICITFISITTENSQHRRLFTGFHGSFYMDKLSEHWPPPRELEIGREVVGRYLNLPVDKYYFEPSRVEGRVGKVILVVQKKIEIESRKKYPVSPVPISGGDGELWWRWRGVRKFHGSFYMDKLSEHWPDPRLLEFAIKVVKAYIDLTVDKYSVPGISTRGPSCPKSPSVRLLKTNNLNLGCSDRCILCGGVAIGYHDSRAGIGYQWTGNCCDMGCDSQLCDSDITR
eukprot:sb/3479503/